MDDSDQEDQAFWDDVGKEVQMGDEQRDEVQTKLGPTNIDLLANVSTEIETDKFFDHPVDAADTCPDDSLGDDVCLENDDGDDDGVTSTVMDASATCAKGIDIDDGLGLEEEELFGSEAEPVDPPPPPPPPPPQAHDAASAAATTSTTSASVSPGVGVAAASVGSEEFGSGLIDESRFTKDENGGFVYKWKVDYASRGGNGRAQCKDNCCCYRESQAGMKYIEKGELRIGRRILMAEDQHMAGGGRMMILWHHAQCMINTMTRARKGTRVLESAEDLDGFEDIRPDDQERLRTMISDLCTKRGTPVKRSAKGPAGAGSNRATGGGGGNNGNTPKKRGRDPNLVGLGRDASPIIKKKKKGTDFREDPGKPKVGDIVWCFPKVKNDAPAGPGGVVREWSIKSPKPELGKICEEPRDGAMIIQFESAEHEKERIDKIGLRRCRKIKGWLRYPRLFEGKKQRIPMRWIQFDRPPPILCSCKKQSWAHMCECGVSCGRGLMSMGVLGLDRP
jgi:hypothetical protein